MHTQEEHNKRREARGPAGQVHQEPPRQRRHRLCGQGHPPVLEGMGHRGRPCRQGDDGHGHPEGREGRCLGDQRPGLDHPDVRHRQDRRDHAHHQHQLQERRAGLRPQTVRHGEPLPHRRRQGRGLRPDRLRPGPGAEGPAQGQLPQREVPPSQKGRSSRPGEAPRHVLDERGQIPGLSDHRRGVQGILPQGLYGF